ncbi:sialoglycan-binding domain-containing protein [Streptococcus mitis]|uniref:sialoglycan-binding domain-containing protein n=1 Tax=Streptococcus mitis TaxID=28037 RepID=UPI00066ED568|nr:sialoglycan-binding domain-containing protein [Streptococcus mitis]
MDNKSSMSRVERLHREKVTRYSIRKYSFGAASVAVAALFMFLGNGAVSADMTAVQPQDESELKVKPNDENTGLDKVQGDTTKQVDNTVVAEPTAKPAAQPIAEEPTQPAAPEVTTPALDKTKLENYISEVKSKLSAGKYANKTEESLALLNSKLASAESTLASATTQDELTKAYQKLVTFVSSGLKNKPKEGPKVDTTNGQPTLGKKAENTEPKSNSIENTGSNDPRNDKEIDKDNAFRTEATDNQKPVAEIPYSLPSEKKIFVYNEEDAGIEIPVYDESGKIRFATVKQGSNQAFGNSSEGENKLDIQWGYTATVINRSESETAELTNATQANPAKIIISGTPSDALKKSASYTKTEDQTVNIGTRFVHVQDEQGLKNSGDTRTISDPGYMYFVLKSQTYKYSIQQPENAGAKISVNDIDNLTEADVKKIKDNIKIEYSKTSQDARFESKKGEALKNQTAVVKDINVDTANKKVVVTYTDDSTDEAALSSVVRTNEKPTVEIQYSDSKPDKKEVYVYASEVNTFDIKIKDDSGKLASAELRRGSNQEFKDVAGEPNKQDTQYGFTANKFTSETTATAENPAVITYTGTPAPEGAFTKEKFDQAIQNGGTPLGWRFVKAMDEDGADARGNGRDATDPTAVNVILKPQTLKYDIKTPAEADKVAVADANSVTDAEFDKIKEKIKLEYSQNNPDERLADKKGTLVDEKEQPSRIQSITKDGNNVVVTYADGSKDTKPLTDFARTNEAPTLDIPYSNKENKQIYLYTTEESDISLKVKDDSGKVKEAVLKFPGGQNESYMDGKNKSAMYLKQEGMTTSEVTASEDSPYEIKLTGTIPKGAWGLNSNTGMTRILYAKDTDDKDTSASFDNNKSVNGYIRFIQKDQTTKYDIKTLDAENKIAVNDANDLTDADLEKIKNNLKVEYAQTNDDARLADKKGEEVADASKVVDKVEKDGDNLVVTYKDGSKDTKPISDVVRTNNAPEVKIPYSVDGKKDVYVYANEDFDIPIKYTDDSGRVVEASVRQGGNKELPQKTGQDDPNVLDNQYNMTVGKISKDTEATENNPATIHITGNLSKTTPGLDAKKFPTDENGEYPIVTRYATATDKDGRNIFNNATGSSYSTDPGGFRIVLKAQTAKYDVKELTDAEKPVVSDMKNIPQAELDKIKENLQLEYSKKNKDKNINKDEAVSADNVKKAVDTVTQDGDNLVVTYKDGSKDTIPVDKVAKLDKQPAIDAVTTEADNKIKAITDNPALSPAEKEKAKAKVNEDKQAALDKIDDATNATDVNTAKTEGTDAVAKVNPVAKDAAKQAIADELKAKNNELDARKDLSDAEKKAAKAEAKKLADAQLAEVANQPDNKPTAAEAAEAQKAVDAAKDKGVADVKTVNPIAKENALKAVADELAKKEKQIDARTDLTKEEKDAAKEEAKGLAKKATDAITAQPDKAATPADAKTAQDAVDAAKKTGVDEVAAVNPPANKKTTAKTAVADEAEAKKQALQNDNTLSDAAKEKLKKEVDDIKEATDAAITGAKKNADVDLAKKAGEQAIKAINSARVPGNKLIAKDPTNLDADEQAKLKKAIEAVNPGATVTVNPDGTASVTLPNGKTEPLKQADLTKAADALDTPNGGNDIKRPVDKVIVKDPAKLTDDEKAKIKQAVRDVNPNAVVTMDDKGTVTVSTPEGKTAAFPASELVRTLADAAKPDSANTGIRKPADKVVGDATNPTDQAKATEKLQKLNGPDAKVQYDDEGNATVIRPDGTIATIPAGDLFKTPEDAEKANGGDDINKPNSQTVVANKTALTEPEREAIKAKIAAVNPEGSVITVNEKGEATVTTPEGKTAVIDADDLVKAADEKTNPKAGNNINNPADRVQVADKAKLTPEEIAKIKAAVEAVNPDSTVVVDEKGNATVTTPEGKTATIPVSELVKAPTDKDNVTGGNQVNTPADRVVVENPAALTPDEKKAIEAKIKAVNPGADVVFDEKGNATVTTPEGKTATIPASDLVKPKADLADPAKQDAVNKPADKVVVDPAKVAADQDLPQEAKDAIKAAVEAVNPGSTVVVDDKGNATVTTPGGKTVVIPKADLVKTEADKETAKAGNNINKPADKVVADKDALTPENIEAIKAKVAAVNPGATVVVDDKGNATVVTPDGQTATIPVTDLVKSPTEAEGAKAGNNVNKPADKVSANKDALTPEDIKAIKAKVEAVNPDAKVFVDDKGNATVSTPDGKTATIPVEDLVKDPAAKETPNAGNKVNTPADKVVVKDPANLTPEEKKAIEDKIKAVNPDAKVAFDDKGNATVTTKDGAVATIPASDLAKTNADLTDPAKQDAVKKPADKTLVKNPAKLTPAEKDAIKAAVAKVNPENTTVVVDEKGNATVTTPDGKTEVIPASDLVKTAKDAEGANAGNNINKPADKVSATPADLTGDKKDEVKAKIKAAVEAVNPGSTVFVDDKGNATVTTPDGKTATIPVEDLLKDPAAKTTPSAGNKVNTPAEKALVDPAVLNDPNATLPKDVKDAIQKAVESVNPGAKVVVDDKGNATVTTPDGKTATIPASDLVKSNAKDDLENAAKQDAIKKPIDQTVVADKDALTEPEKEAIKAKVQEVNPGATVVVDDKGNATVTTPEGKTAVIPADDLVKTADEVLTDPKAGNVINKPADRELVADKDHLTSDDIQAIKDRVAEVNPGASVYVDEKGNATVTTPDGQTATIPVDDLVKTEADKNTANAGNKVNTPADKVLVKDPAKLTAKELEEVEKKIKEVNPGAEVVFDDKGNATVKTKEGNIATIPAADLVKPKADLQDPAKQDAVKKPADKTLVKNPDSLTQDEKDAITAKVKEVNPPADGTTVFVDDKGNATVTTKDGKTVVIPKDDLVKTEAEAANEKAGNNINKPADKTVVANPESLSPEEKKAIEAKVKAVNPDAKAVFVDDKGNATVTLKDGKSATIPATDLVKTEADAAKPNAGNKVNTPADKVVVKDPDALTDADKAKVTEAIKAVNPNAEKVVFDKNGNATVTLTDGTTATIPAADLVKTEAEAAEPEAGNNVNTPADKTAVANPDSLTQDEKDAIVAKVKAVNPGATVAVDDKGNATVTTPEGKTAVIPAADLTKSKEDAAKPKAGNDVVKPADKTVVKDPTSLTDEEKQAITDKLTALNPDATVVVDDKGNATVTPKDGKPVVIPASDLTKTSDAEKAPKAGNDIVKPASKTKVANPDALTPEEKKAIADKVSAVNPGSTVVVDDKGNATVTLENGKTAVIPASDLTKSEKDVNDGKAKDNAVTPASKTKVANPEKLTDAEKKAIADKVKAANPGAEVVVDDKGNATVVKDGNVSVIPSTDLVKVEDDATKPNGGNDANTPAAKTVVENPDSLDSKEKAAVKKAVEAVNSGSTVVVDDKGNATVTKADGTVLNIPASDLVIPAEKFADEAKTAKVKTPAVRTLVGDKENLTKDEKDAVKKSIEAVNPGATVVVDDKGNATVTMPDGSTATISKEQLVKDKEAVSKSKHGGDNLDIDLSKVEVKDLENITPEEKAKFQFKVLGAITNVEEFDLDAYIKSTDKDGNTVYTSKDSKVKITIDKDGNATVEKDGKKELAINIDKAGNVTIVTKEGQVLAIPRDDAFKQRPYVPSNGGGNNSGNGNGTSGNNAATNTDAKVNKAKLEGAIHQLDELIIKESAKLDAETAKEANALSADAKKVFANADASQAEVDAMVKRIEDFMAKVASSTDHATPANDQAAQKPAVAPATAQAAANASQEATTNARKAAKELPNTGTADSTVAMVAAAASALLGLGLAGRRRKEDEEA